MPDANVTVRLAASWPDCRSGLTPMPADAPVSHVGVTYHSRGVVLVTGDGPAAAEPARRLAERLKVVLFAPGVDALTNLPASIVKVGGRLASVQGRLGNFSASVAVAANELRDAGIFSPNEDHKFDLVLDMGRAPHIRQGVAPYGYFAPGSDPELLAHALDTLPKMVGRFWKPAYAEYRFELCAHSAMGIQGCKRCLDACACGAIRSTAGRIEVDAHLCQGCTACTLACPTGALAFDESMDAVAATDEPLATRKPTDGAAFGQVIVDGRGCTLCLACANLCPTGALTRGGGTPPALMFKESLCVQCDLCRAGCPEKAIALQPRFLPDRAEREAIRILNTDEPVPCNRCGAPFTTRRMLAASMALVDSQRSLTMPGGTEALRRCPACRQRDILTC